VYIDTSTAEGTITTTIIFRSDVNIVHTSSDFSSQIGATTFESNKTALTSIVITFLYDRNVTIVDIIWQLSHIRGKGVNEAN